MFIIISVNLKPELAHKNLCTEMQHTSLRPITVFRDVKESFFGAPHQTWILNCYKSIIWKLVSVFTVRKIWHVQITFLREKVVCRMWNGLTFSGFQRVENYTCCRWRWLPEIITPIVDFHRIFQNRFYSARK